MRISHFNSYAYGGAAVAALRIHQGLADLIESHLASRFFYRFAQDDHQNETPTDPNDPSGSNHSSEVSQIKFKPPPRIFPNLIQRFIDRRRQKKIFRLYDRHLAPRDEQLETFAMADLPQSTWLDWPMHDADIVHLHWVSFLADYPSFFRSIPNHVPLVWTLHDMNPFTGGCHYSNSCRKFQQGCGNCPQVVDANQQDVSWHSFNSKRNNLNRNNITVVSPCQWLTDLARSSPIWPATTRFETIHYGLDLEKFRPMEKTLARHQLGLEVDPHTVLIAFGADNLNNPRKGGKLLTEGLEHVAAYLQSRGQQSGLNDVSEIPDRSFTSGSPNTADQSIENATSVAALVFGRGQIDQLPGVPLFPLGFVECPSRQRLIYAASDFIVVPSLEDNQPQVGLEAMACGRPVVSFDSGGISQYVRHERTGMLAEPGSALDLSQKMIAMISQPKLRELLGRQARFLVETEFEIKKQSRRYFELYQQLLAKSGNQSIGSN